MGVLTMQGIGAEQAEFMKLQVPAVAVDQVIPGGPGEKAGLKNADAIVAINSRPIERLSSPELTGQNVLRSIMILPPGSEVTLTVRRAGQERQVSLVLEAMPLLPDEAPRYVADKLGLAVREKVPLGRYLVKSPTAKIAGLMVIAIGRRTAASSGGLKVGDVITAINGRPVRTVDVFKKILSGALTEKPTEGIILMIHRGGAEPQAVTILPQTDRTGVQPVLPGGPK
jgi:C-terminal processing protease CtpA/Prc